MLLDPADLSDAQRLAVIEGTLPIASLNGTNGNGKHVAQPSEGSVLNDDKTVWVKNKRKLKWGERQLSRDQRFTCLETCIRSSCKQVRNARRRIMRIRAAIAALELSKVVTAKEIGQMVLETMDEISGNACTPLTAEQRATLQIPQVEWIWQGLLPARDAAILGGRPKVGKTALAYMAVAALLKRQSFLGFGPPPQPRKVILISDDQGDANTRDLLQKYGIWDHEDLLWIPRFRITEKQVDLLLDLIRNNPGAVVLLDSLRSTTRSSGLTENDVEMGALLYDLKQSVINAGGALWVIHHANKTDDNAVGIEAISGSSALAGAVNFVATIHYTIEKNKLQKKRPERRLFSEGRGEGLDHIVRLEVATGACSVVSTFDDYTEQTQVQEALCDPVKDIAKAALYRWTAFRYLVRQKAVSPDSAIGLLDLCKAIGIAPSSARVMKDLGPDPLKQYKALGTWLDSLRGYVTKADVPGKQFKPYHLEPLGAEWAAQQDWSSR